MVERRDAHEYAAVDRRVVPTRRLQAPHHLEHPASRGPAGGAPDVRAVAGKCSGHDDTGNNRADGYAGVELPGIGDRILVGHEPPRPFAFAMIRVEIDM